jgi:hypothetical protein
MGGAASNLDRAPRAPAAGWPPEPRWGASDEHPLSVEDKVGPGGHRGAVGIRPSLRSATGGHQNWVRPSRLRLELRLLTFIGPDSERAARLIAAGALQDRAWPLSELTLLSQGRKNSGYVTEIYLRRLAHVTAGLDSGRALRQRESLRVNALLDRARRQARRLSVDGTPTFFLLRPGRPPQRLRPDALTYDSLSSAIRSALE